MSELSKLLERHKSDFLIDNEELGRRISNSLIGYNNMLPEVNDEDVLCLRVRKQYVSLQNMLIDSTAKLSGDYNLDSTNSRILNGMFIVVYMKKELLQKKDLVKMKKEIKAEYQLELDTEKALFVEGLITQQTKQAQELAAQKARDSVKVLQAELTKLLTQ